VRIALIANPGSGSSDPDAIEAELRAAGAEVERFGIDEARRAAGSGAERLAVAGGDGSVGPAAAAAGPAGVPLAVIAAGTANDFARRLGLPSNVDEACLLAVRGQQLRALELGTMTSGSGGAPEDRPFVNAASLGLPAPAAARARYWKSALGPLAYALGAVHAGLTADPVRCRARCDGETLHDGPAWQLTVACSGAFGAGSRLDSADPSDGRLDVVAVEAGSRLRLLPLAYALRRGNLTSRRRVRHARGGSADVEAPAETTFNVDGELVAAASTRFGVEAEAFRLVVG
jgi:diacylglycerol kinase (ATP)